MDVVQALALAIIEGLTEFLPVSSTGHIMIGSFLMGIGDDPFTKDYTVAVQFGAIAAVIVLYWRNFCSGLETYLKLAAGFFPAGVVGVLVKKHIDVMLGQVEVVAWALIIGGICLIAIDKKAQTLGRVQSLQQITLRQAFLVGIFQCVAFIPGVSRSAATILGGRILGLSAPTAAEFSFLLAVPTLTAATIFKLYKSYENISPDQWRLLGLGNVISFVVGVLAIKGFVSFLNRRGLSLFGYYRVAVGLAVLVLWYRGSQIQLL